MKSGKSGKGHEFHYSLVASILKSPSPNIVNTGKAGISQFDFQEPNLRLLLVLPYQAFGFGPLVWYRDPQVLSFVY